MPCFSPIGYPAEKMSVREKMMRKGVKADSRFSFEEIAFQNCFDTPLTADTSGKLLTPIETVRLAPSAVNKQPWRIAVADDVVHFYLQRSKNFSGGRIDMQKIDMGIALCHFALTAKEQGMVFAFVYCRRCVCVTLIF